MNGLRYTHTDRDGRERGPYTATHAEGPWYCMVPDGVEVPPGSPVLQSGGFVGLIAFMKEHGELLHKVGWASQKSLLAGPDERGVGWERA